MQAQDVFNRVWDHFIAQGNPLSYRAQNPDSETAYAACRYRSENGARCAAGLFMEDADYSEGYEGKAATTVLANGPVFGPASAYPELLDDLQSAHDDTAGEFMRGNPDSPALLRERLQKVATRFNLTVPA